MKSIASLVAKTLPCLERVTFILTNKCVAECAFCCFGCKRSNDSFLKGEDVIHTIDKAKNILGIKYVVFTGGEPFLHKDIYSFLAHCKSVSLGTRIVTNGFWGETASSAMRIAKKLAAAELTEINISSGYFHQEYIPLEHVINAALSCLEHDIKVLLNFDAIQDKPYDYESLIDILTQKSKFYKCDISNIMLMSSLAIPNNRYTNNSFYGYAGDSKRENTYLLCNDLYRGVTVNYDNKYRVCCGLYSEATNFLSSPVASSDVRVFYEAMKDNLLLLLIYAFGPEYICGLLGEDYSPMQHPCMYCKKIFEHGYHENLGDKISPELIADMIRIMRAIQ